MILVYHERSCGEAASDANGDQCQWRPKKPYGLEVTVGERTLVWTDRLAWVQRQLDAAEMAKLRLPRNLTANAEGLWRQYISSTGSRKHFF